MSLKHIIHYIVQQHRAKASHFACLHQRMCTCIGDNARNGNGGSNPGCVRTKWMSKRRYSLYKYWKNYTHPHYL